MKTVLAAIFILLASVSYADQKAITDTGEEVILKRNGTWEYIDKAQKTNSKIETNREKFTRPPSSSFLLKSTRNNSAFWIDTNKWAFRKATNNQEAEYEFQLKGKDLYGMALSEGVQIPLKTLTELALENAKKAAPDARIDKQEYRYVNGNKVIYQEMSGTMQGIRFKFLGYYYSDSAGTTQWVAYTGYNLVTKYKSEIYNFLNGLASQ